VSRFGLVVSFQAQPGQGDALEALLLEAASSIEAEAACELYVVGRSVEDPDAVWVTEVWTSREAHAASLDDPSAAQLVGRARPLIAGVAERFELSVAGGKGLADPS
jgi:quinol monooxygenase YgiN